jgi:hypothetical protein
MAATPLSYYCPVDLGFLNQTSQCICGKTFRRASLVDGPANLELTALWRYTIRGISRFGISRTLNRVSLTSEN